MIFSKEEGVVEIGGAPVQIPRDQKLFFSLSVLKTEFSLGVIFYSERLGG